MLWVFTRNGERGASFLNELGETWFLVRSGIVRSWKDRLFSLKRRLSGYGGSLAHTVCGQHGDCVTVLAELLFPFLVKSARIGAMVSMLVGASYAQTTDASRPPAEWERVVEGRYENKGVAKVERLGDRWALSILCRGTHTVYIDAPTSSLAQYENQFVAARYDYIVRLVEDPRCVRAPCGPFTERRISLERLTPLSITDEEARKEDRECN